MMDDHWKWKLEC